MTKNIGFIGAGKIGEAIIKGIIGSELCTPKNIIASDIEETRLDYLKESLGIRVTTQNKEVIKKSDVIVLAVKPKFVEKVASEIKDVIKKDQLLISVAAGVPTIKIEACFEGVKVIRVMPNISCVVGESASAISLGKNATEKDQETAKEIFEACGKVVLLPESLMDSVTGLSGSSPAFVFMIIEALADGGVHEGLDRKTALYLSAQTVLGAAKMVLETKMHPGELKDMVTSPGGTTIRGIRVMEEHKVRSAMMGAVIEATRKSKELGKKAN